jgi:hypothetical protein
VTRILVLSEKKLYEAPTKRGQLENLNESTPLLGGTESIVAVKSVKHYKVDTYRILTQLFGLKSLGILCRLTLSSLSEALADLCHVLFCLGSVAEGILKGLPPPVAIFILLSCD